MKKKLLYFFLPLLIIISMVSNSCKKESKTQLVESLLTHGQWQLASVMVFHYLGAQQLTTDTLSANCTKQVFIFTGDHNCTYSNFACKTQNSSGNWSLTSDDLYLQANMFAIDTVAGGTAQDTVNIRPFVIAQIYNLGQYSLVLQTGDISVYPTPTTKRTIIQYGFVHPSKN